MLILDLLTVMFVSANYSFFSLDCTIICIVQNADAFLMVFLKMIFL